MDFKSQLLIIGNGFDLHCKLKSSYRDFFRGEILDTYHEENWGITRMRQGCFGFWETLLFKYYEKYGDKDYKWCDVEEIIKNTLQNICYSKESKDSRIKGMEFWKVALLRVYSKLVALDDNINQNDIIFNYLFEYSVTFFYKNHSKIKDHYDLENLNLLIKHLSLELNNFENRFCRFIRNQIVNPNNANELNIRYVVNAINLIAELAELPYMRISYESPEFLFDNEIIEEALALREANINILSFNYTALFDILEIESPCVYSNVHGKLCNKQCKVDCKSSNIIFGIDDAFVQSQNDTYELMPFSKTFRKMNDTSVPESILPDKECESLAIKFYGHSLSESDYSYFQSIFDYYNIYGNNKVSLIFYYSKGYEQYEAIYKLINSYGKTLANLNQGKNLIHKLLLENRLKIVEIKDDLK